MTSPTGDLKLELVQVIFRHGARTNSKSEIKNTTLENVDSSLHETYGYEQLTNVGKAQAYNLGRVLRDRYDEFLGPLYKSDDLYAYSSDYDRTKMSLQLVLAGLCPPSSEQIWNENLRWQPIPTYYAPQEADLLLKAFEMPKFRNCLLVCQKSMPQFKESSEKCKSWTEFFQSKRALSGHKIVTVNVIGIFNLLCSHKAAKAKLPDWYTDELYEELKEQIATYFDLMTLTRELCKWKIGPLVRRLFDNMDVQDKMKSPRKIYLYSGHELNLAAYTRAHGVKEFRYPDYSSAVILEKLRDSKNRLYVRMLARTGDGGTFVTLKLGKYKEYCPIEEYIEIIKDVVPSNEEIDSMYEEIQNDLKTLHASDSVFKSENGSLLSTIESDD